MDFSIENKNNVAIFTLKSNNLDTEISAQLKAKVLIIAQPDIDALFFDLSMVEYADSAGLGALLLAYRQMKEYDIPVALIGLQEPVKNLLSLSLIDELFDIFENTDEAMEFYSREAING
jgi:anti-sigma B factor antagonist